MTCEGRELVGPIGVGRVLWELEKTYGGTLLEASQVKSLTGGDRDVVEGDGGARGLAGLGSRGGGESAGALLERSSGGQRSAHSGGHNGVLEEMHDDNEGMEPGSTGYD